MANKHSGGEWNTACDSYGRVRHSRKYDCVYTVLKGDGGDRIVTVAARIEKYADARLIAAAPALLNALEVAEATIVRLERHAPGSANGTLAVIRAAIAKAEV